VSDAVATARRRAYRIGNQVLLSLTALGAAAALGGGFLTMAPNRLLSGRPIGLWHAAGGPATLGVAAAGLALVALALAPQRKPLHGLAAALCAGLLLYLAAASGDGAARLAAVPTPLARISVGAAFWVMLGCAALAIVDALQRAAAGPAAQLLVAAALLAGLAGLAAAGSLDALSLAREYALRRDGFGAALLRHVLLVAGSVGPAVAIGVPLGIAAVRRPRFRAPLFAMLNLLQTIPSVALFGLLIVPLSALGTALPQLSAVGIGGIGVAPALIALVLYALLPIARNTAAGIAGVDRAVLEAGTGMGLSPRQVFWKLELPLAAPVLLSGLRIVTVQTIGLAVVAALIGAGGLGTFVFEGLGQYAVDLVLLGALPAIGLALAVNFLLQTIAAALRGPAARA